MPAYFIALLLLFSISGTTFASFLGSGKATMTGEIVEAACSIATDDVLQEVNFSTIPLSDFADGNAPASMPFHIRLENCVLEKNNGGTWSDVSVTFDGHVNDNHPDMFSMTGEGRGVSLKITDSHGYKAIPGQPLPAVKLSEDSTDIYFNIHLERNGDVLSVGDISSFIRFMVAYQ